MDKCVREKENLYQFKLDEEVLGESQSVGTAESYFRQYPEKDYLMEYSFETISQLKRMLDVVWENEEYMKDISKTILAAAIKNKPLDVGIEKFGVTSEQDEKNQIPTFIYNF